MKITRLSTRLLVILVCFSFTQITFAKSPVWKVSKGDNHLYIGGTIHLLSYQDYPLPVIFDEVYKDSKVLIFETDMNKAQDPAVKKRMQAILKYSDGSKLKQHIKPETYKALEAYLKTIQIPIETFEDFKPSMVSTILSIMELRRLGINGAGVDLFYNTKATDDHKKLGKLETLDQQLLFLGKIGESNPDEYLIYTLDEIKNMSSTFKDLRQAWRKGDMDKLAKLGIIPLQKFPETYQMILVDRNKAWIPQIEKMMATKEVEMILVGALHLAGKDSVLNQLKDLGYKIEQY